MAKRSIGSHLTDYDSLHIKFLHEGKFTTLHGECDNGPQLHKIRRMLNKEAIAEIYSMQVVRADTQFFHRWTYRMIWNQNWSFGYTHIARFSLIPLDYLLADLMSIQFLS